MQYPIGATTPRVKRDRDSAVAALNLSSRVSLHLVFSSVNLLTRRRPPSAVCDGPQEIHVCQLEWLFEVERCRLRGAW